MRASGRGRGAPAPAAPFTCVDAAHCHRPHVAGRGICNPRYQHPCPGLGAVGPTPLTYSGRLHIIPAVVPVCGNCQTHGAGVEDRNTDHLVTSVGPGVHSVGYKSRLCPDCIHDELELFYQRTGTHQPLAPASLRQVNRWPRWNFGDQDLCICPTRAIRNFHRNCHACRDEAFRILAHDPKHLAEDILATRTTPVITGEKLCTANGGIRAHTVSAANQQRRSTAHVRHRCPCGAKPEAPQPFPTQEYISICLACMGVHIRRHNIPDKYSRARIMGPNNETRRRSTRIAGRNVVPTSTAPPPGQPLLPPVVYAPTKGPKRALRSHEFRVNIERGWVAGDGFVGGTF